MTPAALAAAGRALTGSDRWRRPLARMLSCDPALVRRWARGSAPVPGWAAEKIRELAGERMKRLAEVAG